MGADQVGDRLLDMGPEAAAAFGIGRFLVVLAGLGHVLDRHHDLEVPPLLTGWSHDLDRRLAAKPRRKPALARLAKKPRLFR